MAFLFLNGSANSLLAWGLLPPPSRERFDWLFWLLAAAPVGALVILGSLVALFLILRPGPAAPIARERVHTQLAVLGPLSRREWAMVVVLGLTVVAWLIVPPATLSAGAVAALGFLAAVITGNLDQKSIRELDWDFILFYGVAVGIASQAECLGIGQLAAAAMSPWLGELAAHPALVVLGLTLGAIAVQIVLAKEQAILLVMIALVPAAPTLGIAPWVVVLIFLATSSLWFFPSQTPAYLVAYSTMEGRLFSHHEARRVAFAFSGVIILSLLLVVPYWHLLGLL
jgi:di/tricarboxylate transporter